VRNDMVNGGSRVAAHAAVRMRGEVFAAGLLPFAIISASAGIRPALVMSGLALAICLALAFASNAMRHDLSACAKVRRARH